MNTHVAIVLDRSGSMGFIREETIQGFNEQVELLKKSENGMKTTVSLVTFATEPFPPTLWEAELKDLKKLTKKDYKPDGMTAMLDAVAYTIDRLTGEKAGEEADDAAVLMLIISDGLENNSQKETHESVARRIQGLNETGKWTFTYLGSNQDLSQVSQQLNIPERNCASFVSTPEGTQAAYKMQNACMSSYVACRLSGDTQVRNFYEPSKTGDEDAVTGSGMFSTTDEGGYYPSVIRDIRGSQGISQEGMAKRLQVSARTVHRWESGRSVPHQSFRQALERLKKKV